MAELLIVVVIVAAVLLYAADRARKLRARARQMSGMNDRLAAAAAKIDAEQQRKRARVRASAELTSVLPAIKRPPLTIPGMGGHEAGDEEAAPAADDAPGAAGAPAAGEARAAAEAPAAQAPAAEAPAAAHAPLTPAPRAAEGTLSMPAVVTGDDVPAAKIQVTSEGTLIMPPVPGQGPDRPGGGRPAADQIPDEHTSSQERTSRR